MEARNSRGVVALLGAWAVGCSSPARQPPTESAGTAEIDLTLSGGVVLESVHYVVSSAAGVTIAQGSVDVQSSLVLQTIVTLPPGAGDVATFTAASADGGVTCTGTSRPFSVLANQAAHVSVSLQCRTPTSGGALVTFSGSFTNCASIASISVDPSEVIVGAATTLGATASGPDPGALTYTWSAPSGSFGDASASTTSFTCTAAGAVLVTLAVGDGAAADGALCGAAQSFTVQCGPGVDAGPTGCGDTSSDPNNCGACGHSCLGGACTGGACQPVVLASGVCPTSIAVDDANVYFTHDVLGTWAVERVAKTGGPVTVLASQTSGFFDLYVTAHREARFSDRRGLEVGPRVASG